MSKVSDKTQPDLHNRILELRRSKKLHSAVEEKLTHLAGIVAPEFHAVKEPVGLAGGRNDLLMFEFSGQKVLFEIFATRNQVSRDLRILDKTKADRKIAVIIDPELDPKVFEAFLRENPEDNYPFVFVGELFQEPPAAAILKLRELVLGDEEAKFMRMLHAKMSKNDFYEACKKLGIEVLSKDDKNITLAKLFVTLVLAKCVEYGIARDRVQNLGKWLSQKTVLEIIFRNASYGMNVILYTDFIQNFSVYSDFELVDWIRASYLLSQPYVFMSLTALIHEIDEKYLKGKPPLLKEKHPRMFVGMTQVHEGAQGRLLVVSLPKDTNRIIMIPPIENAKSADDYIQMIEVIPEGHLLAVRIEAGGEDDVKD